MDMNIFKSITIVVMFFCLSSVALVASSDSSLCLDEATMSEEQAYFFRKFLWNNRIDTTDYHAQQYCKVGEDTTFFVDTDVDKFLQRSGLSESDFYEFRYGQSSLVVCTGLFRDTMRISCRSDDRADANNFYLCIEVIPCDSSR